MDDQIVRGIMMKTRVTYLILKFILAAIQCALLVQAQQTQNPLPGVLTSPVDDRTVVRFYYHSTNGDRLIYPLVLRVASANGERVNVAPILAEGRTAYIALAEMRELVAGMTRSITMGQQTRGAEVLGAWEMIPITEAMDVVIIFSEGAARGVILRKEICKTLGSLDSAIKTQRAHWEFQRFRYQHGCRVPGFDSAKFN